jgi:hypothetical protein
MDQLLGKLADFLRTLDYYVPRYMPYVLLPFLATALLWEIVKWRRRRGEGER